jgi:hypothetical protein
MRWKFHSAKLFGENTTCDDIKVRIESKKLLSAICILFNLIIL